MDYCTDSDDPACDYFMGNGPDMVCYDSNNDVIVFSITSPEDCQGDGLMWVSTDDGPDGGDDEGPELARLMSPSACVCEVN